MSTVATETSAAEQLQQSLSDPKVVDGLDRLDTVTFAVESFEGFLSRGEVITESIAESVIELKRANVGQAKELLQKAPQMIETGTKLADAASAMNVDELARSRILGRMTDPQTLEMLNRLLDRLPLAAFMLESLEGFIGRGETITDNLAAAICSLNLGDIDFDAAQLTSLLEALPKLKEAGEKLLESGLVGDELAKIIDAGVGMVDSGMLDKKVVSVLGTLGKQAADTYTEVARQPVEPIGGLLATLKATKDPEIQKSLGFFFAFAKHLK